MEFYVCDRRAEPIRLGERERLFDDDDDGSLPE